ncbi:MAG: glycosyltransferase family 4 protein [Gemmatimonadales bacterium]
MPPIRFCMVTTFYPPTNFGGDGVQVERLAHLLAGHGHEVTVVHAADAYRALGGPNEVPAQREGPIKVVPISTSAGAMSPLAIHLSGRPLFSKRQLERALRGPFDVIHFHNPSLIGGPGVFELGEASLRLYTAHEQWLVCPTHVLWKNKREICEKPTCTRCSLTYRRPPQPWRRSNFLERSMTQLDALIAPSRTSAKLHQRFADILPIEHIPHFVPPTPGGNGRVAGSRPYFLFVGRHESIKGLGPLIKAFRRRGGEDLLIAGDGPDTDAMKAAAADSPHIKFLGWQDRDQLDSLYRHALAAVVPTQGHESFGLVAVEAFARGTPAIVHGVGALQELIEESDGGLSYRTEDELHRALDLIAGDPAAQAAFGERGRAAHRELWAPEVHLRRYLQLIEELAAWRGADALARTAAEAGGEADRGRLLELELLR